MPVKMVGGKVGYYRRIRRIWGFHKLKGGQLAYRNRVFVLVFKIYKQIASDISPQKGFNAGIFKNLMYNRGGGGLAVAAGYGYDFALSES